MSVIPHDKWKWYGKPGHFIASQWCRFHLATVIGKYLISTIGEYVHPRHGKGSEVKENQWLDQNWPGEDLGIDGRKYETLVFKVNGKCTCGCDGPLHNGESLEAEGYYDARSARNGHMRLCRKYSIIGV